MSSNPYEPPTADVAVERELTAEQRTGRLVLLIHIAILFAFSIAAMALNPPSLDWGIVVLAAAGIRDLLIVALCYGTYRGSVAAARILMVLLGLGAASAAFLLAGDVGPVPMPVRIALAVLGLVNGSFFCVLLASDSVEAFLNHQRAKNSA